MATLSRNAQVLHYFVQRSPEKLGVVKLQKLAFLADLYAREYLGRPLSDFKYVFYTHGPFDSDLYTAIAELEEAGYVRTRPESFLSGKNRRSILNVRVAEGFDFARPEIEILDYVASVYGRVPLKPLLAEVYATAPMKAARKNQPVPMGMADHRAKRTLGYDLESVLAEEAEIDRGNYVLAADFFNALRTETLAADAGKHHGLHP